MRDEKRNVRSHAFNQIEMKRFRGRQNIVFATRGLRLRGGWVDPLSLLDSLQYLAGYLVHFAPSGNLLQIKNADSESSNHPTGSAPYGSDNSERPVSYLHQRKG